MSINIPAVLMDAVTEDAVLGSLLAAERAELLDLFALLAAAPGFTHPTRQALYAAIGAGSAGDTPPDFLALRDTLLTSGHTTAPDGGDLLDWIGTLDQQAPIRATERAAAATRLIRYAARRHRYTQLQQITADLLDGADEDTTGAAMMTAGLETRSQRVGPGDLSAAAGRVSDRWVSLLTRKAGVELSTGSGPLDAVLYGLHPGHSFIIGARPGQGKTVAALDLTRAIIKQRKAVLVFSLEMILDDVYERLLLAEGAFNMRTAAKQGDEATIDRGIDLSATLAYDWRPYLHIYDPSAATWTWERITTEVRRMKAVLSAQGVPLGAFVVDYLQLVPQDLTRRRQLEVRAHTSQVVQMLAQLAKEVGATFIGLSQLARPPKTDTVKPPSMFELKETSDLEQAADEIVLLHRPDQYDPEDDPGRVHFIIAKNRHGETASVERGHQLQYYRMVDLAYDYQQPPDPDRF